MRAGVHSPAFVLGALLIFAEGCGGGGGGGTQTPLLQPDFAIAFSTAAIRLSQGNASAPLTVSVSGLNGFSGSVQVGLSGIPSGVTTAPVSPFSIAAGQSVSVIFGAAPTAATGEFNLSAQGSSGALSHSAPLSLTIQSGAASNLSRSSFLPNDSVPAIDAPAGEPRRRQIVFDPNGGRFFVANPAMNRVEVYSDPSPSLLAAIDAPGASSVDLSSDAATLWVATNTEELLAVNAASLQVKARYPMVGLSPIPGVVFNRPTEAIGLASGKVALRLRHSSASESLLALWDPASNTATDLTSTAPAVIQNGLGVMVRSGDRTRLLAAANDVSGEVVALDSSGNVVAGPRVIGNGAISAAAANSNGTQFAAILSAGGAQQVLVFGSQLNLQASYNATNAADLVFSPIGDVLYVSESLGNGRVITVLAAANLQKIGQVSDLAVQGIATAIEESDASHFVLRRGNRGIGILDMSSPGALSAPAPGICECASGPACGRAERGGNFHHTYWQQFSFGRASAFRLANSRHRERRREFAIAGNFSCERCERPRNADRLFLKRLGCRCARGIQLWTYRSTNPAECRSCFRWRHCLSDRPRIWKQRRRYHHQNRRTAGDCAEGGGVACVCRRSLTGLDISFSARAHHADYSGWKRGESRSFAYDSFRHGSTAEIVSISCRAADVRKSQPL